jgi:hypothetical protein
MAVFDFDKKNDQADQSGARCPRDDIELDGHKK